MKQLVYLVRGSSGLDEVARGAVHLAADPDFQSGAGLDVRGGLLLASRAMPSAVWWAIPVIR